MVSATPPSPRKVRGGDLLGMTFSAGVTLYSNSTTGYTYASGPIDPTDGTQEPLGSAPGQGAYAIAATLEPDADQDGYGDETQDHCPANPARQAAPCISVPPVTVCVVPKVKRRTLARARKAILAARCRVGRVIKPKHRRRRGYHLVVARQSPKAGLRVAAGTKVALRLRLVKKRR